MIVLECADGKTATKTFAADGDLRSAYDAGARFRMHALPTKTWGDFLVALQKLTKEPGCFAIRGEPVPDLPAEGWVYRRLRDRPGEPASFRSVPQRWVAYDFDDTIAPFDLAKPEASVRAWHATLPAELRNASAAFLLSASAHRWRTVRGKLFVWYSRPISERMARAFARHYGADPSVAGAIQPIYIASPRFEGGTDPLGGHRAPIVFRGAPAKPPPRDAIATTTTATTTVPADADPSDRGRQIANIIRERWAKGGRVETNALLHLCGWFLDLPAFPWEKNEIKALIRTLDDETDEVPEKRKEHLHILQNAQPLDGPGSAKAWLGEDFAEVDAIADIDVRPWLARSTWWDAPLLVLPTKGDTLFVRAQRANRYRECGKSAFRVMMKEQGWGGLLTYEKGEKMVRASDEWLREQHGKTCDSTITDFSRPGGASWDERSRRMLLGIEPAAITPKKDDAVDAWLRAIAGAKYPALAEWIAGTAQKHIARPATALVLIGEKSIGKTLLAVACAGLWGSEDPVELGHVVKQFNASMARCPIVLDDECRVLARKAVSTEDFRVLIQKREREYEPKGQEHRTLLGAQRFILTGNDVSALVFADAMGIGAVDAIAERLLLIEVSQKRTAQVLTALNACRAADGEVDLARIKAHLAHIQKCVAVPSAGQRFIGADPNKQAALQAAVASTVEGHPEVFDRIREVLLGGREGDDCFLAAGLAWVAAEKLATLLDRRDAAWVREALKPFHVRGKKAAKRHGKTVNAHGLDIDLLIVGLGFTANDAKKAREIVEQRKAEAQERRMGGVVAHRVGQFERLLAAKPT